jgi:4-diphosphocytidyl-2-C-methyl-D-erythritol kinase
MPSAPAPVVLTAPAKLTTSLRVLGVRGDGYHLLDAEMVTLDQTDILEVVDAVDAAGPTVEVVGPSGLPLDVGPDATNLVLRALTLTGRSPRMRVTKCISPGAGLGGGSSDAAAVLRWAGWTDLEAAAELGADVPFCVVGGRARVRGIGELVEPLPFEARTFTLLTPPFGCSTVEVYRAWDRLGAPVGVGTNDLESAALVVEPRLAEWRDRLGDATGEEPRLAGSGSTWFVEGEFPGEEREVAHAVPAGIVPAPGWFTPTRR